MLWNLRTEGMAVEDGPHLSGSCVSLESLLRPLGHRHSRELPAPERILRASRIGLRSPLIASKSANKAFSTHLTSLVSTVKLVTWPQST